MINKCPHNTYVACEKKDCSHCGWDPQVAAMRRYEIRKTGAANQRITAHKKSTVIKVGIKREVI